MPEKHGKKERRKHRRTHIDLPVEIASLAFKFRSHDSQCRIVNISCSGLYCQVNRFFPLFTKLDVTFFLDPAQNCHHKSHNCNHKINKITCHGIVVRTEPAHPIKGCREYRIAIFVPDGIPINPLSGLVIN